MFFTYYYEWFDGTQFQRDLNENGGNILITQNN